MKSTEVAYVFALVIGVEKMTENNSVLYITNLPAPYKMDFFTKLSEKFDLHVLVERETASDRDPNWIKENKCDFDLKFLSGPKFRSSSRISFEVIKYLNSKYKVIIVNGYASPTSMIALSYLSLKGIPFIFSSDGMIPRKPHSIREKLKKALLNKATICMSSGKMNTQALLQCGIKEDNIRVYPFSSIHDAEIEDNQIGRDKDSYKRKIGCTHKHLLLYVGQMIYRKGVDILVDAFENIKDDDIELICVGGGTPYFNRKSDLRIQYMDFKDKETLMDYYRAADLLILPTREDIWGLVVNEAMAHGCPVVTTTNCGAGIEMVEQGKNGFLIPANDALEMSKLISKIFHEEQYSDLSYECINTAHKYTIEKMAERTTEIIDDYIRCVGKRDL